MYMSVGMRAISLVSLGIPEDVKHLLANQGYMQDTTAMTR